ncbi:rCG64397, partial [Rattus norvegicus]
MMLRFYSFYKQATEGPCKLSRLGFWDPIGRYKWDAWSSLGDMTKEEAMIAYVEEMKKIIETMPMTEKVEELLHVIGPFYEIVEDKKNSKSSDLTSDLGNVLTSSNAKAVKGNTVLCVHQDTNEDPGEDASGVHHLTSDSDSEVYCDSMEQFGQEEYYLGGDPAQHLEGSGFCEDAQLSPGNGSIGKMQMREVKGKDRGSRGSLNEQIALVLIRLQEDMQNVLQRLHKLETLTASQAKLSWQTSNQPSSQRPSWWPFEMSPGALAFAIIWPFIAQWLVHLYYQRRR